MDRHLCGPVPAALALLAAVWLGGFGSSARAGEARVFLCTTFPVCQITRNVTQGREGVTVQLMLPGQLGCPHDYALTPQDMRKLAQADALIVNGLGLEGFLGAPVKKANGKLIVIDSSQGAEDILRYAGGHDHGHHGHDEAEDSEHAHGHHHDCVNPHLFVSPRMTGKLALNIAAGLGRVDAEGAALYLRNAQTYAEKMNKLADELAALGKRLANNRIVQPHGIFDYLARDAGLEIVGVMQAHGQEPSAAEMTDLARVILEKKAGAIFTEPQYPEKVGRTLARETKVSVAMLDPAATGPEDAPLDHFESVMRKNMKILEATLGVK